MRASTYTSCIWSRVGFLPLFRWAAYVDGICVGSGYARSDRSVREKADQAFIDNDEEPMMFRKIGPS